MENRKSRSSKRELSSKKIFKQMLESKFTQYKTSVLEYINDNEKVKTEVKSKDKVKASGSSLGASRTILTALNVNHGASPKLRKHMHARDLMNREGFTKDVKNIARLLASMYQDLLEKCTHQDAISFANACMDIVVHNINKNEEMKFDNLLKAPSLQAMLVDTIKESPKVKLTLQQIAGTERTVFDAITRPVLYCAENKRFYKSQYSSASEFGFISLETLTDMLECQNLLFKINKKFDYKPMQEEVSKFIRKSSFLKREEKSSEGFVDPTPRSEDEAEDSSSEEKLSRSIS